MGDLRRRLCLAEHLNWVILCNSWGFVIPITRTVVCFYCKYQADSTHVLTLIPDNISHMKLASKLSYNTVLVAYASSDFIIRT